MTESEQTPAPTPARWQRLATTARRWYRVTVLGLALLVITAAIGALMGPAWEPVPWTQPLAPQAQDTAIGGLRGVWEADSYPVREHIQTIQINEDVSIEARVLVPQGAPGQTFPGLVMLHGAGTGLFTEAFTDLAPALAEAGAVVVVPNKRLDTYSIRHRDYQEMAQDYEKSFDYLRSLPEVDPTQTGLYCVSEGCYVGPVLASERTEVSFLIHVSAPVVPGRWQAAFASDNYLRNTGVPTQVFRAIPRALGMAIPGGGFEYADFDVRPYFEQLDIPVMIVYGTDDLSVPVQQGPIEVITHLEAGGNTNWSVRYYENADHGILVDGELAQDFPSDMSAWIQNLPASGGIYPKVAGGGVVQTFSAEEVPLPRWFGDGDSLVVVVIVALVGMAFCLTVGLSNMIARRHRIFRPGVSGAVVSFSVFSVATIVGLVAYLLAVAALAVNYETDVRIVQWGWLGVRVLGVAAMFALALLIDHLQRIKKEHGRAMLRSPKAVIVSTIAILSGGLLILICTYWGVFQLGI